MKELSVIFVTRVTTYKLKMCAVWMYFRCECYQPELGEWSGTSAVLNGEACLHSGLADTLRSVHTAF